VRGTNVVPPTATVEAMAVDIGHRAGCTAVRVAGLETESQRPPEAVECGVYEGSDIQVDLIGPLSPADRLVGADAMDGCVIAAVTSCPDGLEAYDGDVDDQLRMAAAIPVPSPLLRTRKGVIRELVRTRQMCRELADGMESVYAAWLVQFQLDVKTRVRRLADAKRETGKQIWDCRALRAEYWDVLDDLTKVETETAVEVRSELQFLLEDAPDPFESPGFLNVLMRIRTYCARQASRMRDATGDLGFVQWLDAWLALAPATS
jgi:hypothetical protein